MEIIRTIADCIIIFYGILFLLAIPYAVYAAHQEEKLQRAKAEQEEKKQAADGRSYGILSNRVDELEEIAFQARKEADRVGAEFYVYRKEHEELHKSESEKPGKPE